MDSDAPGIRGSRGVTFISCPSRLARPQSQSHPPLRCFSAFQPGPPQQRIPHHPRGRAAWSRTWPLLPPRSLILWRRCPWRGRRHRFVSCRSAPFPCSLGEMVAERGFIWEHHSAQDFCRSRACTGGSVPPCDAVRAFTSDSFGEEPRFHGVLYHDDAPEIIEVLISCYPF